MTRRNPDVFASDLTVYGVTVYAILYIKDIKNLGIMEPTATAYATTKPESLPIVRISFTLISESDSV